MTHQGFRRLGGRGDHRSAGTARCRGVFHRPDPHALARAQGLPEKRPGIRRCLHPRARSALGRRPSRTSNPARHLVLLYWMDRSPRNIVLQVPGHYGVQRGTFALRSPARPNPIAMSVVRLLGIEGANLSVSRARLPRRHAIARHQALFRLDRQRARRSRRLAQSALNYDVDVLPANGSTASRKREKDP